MHGREILGPDLSYVDTPWLHRKAWNIGRCPQRLNCQLRQQLTQSETGMSLKPIFVNWRERWQDVKVWMFGLVVSVLFYTLYFLLRHLFSHLHWFCTFFLFCFCSWISSVWLLGFWILDSAIIKAHFNFFNLPVVPHLGPVLITLTDAVLPVSPNSFNHQFWQESSRHDEPG